MSKSNYYVQSAMGVINMLSSRKLPVVTYFSMNISQPRA